MKTKIILGLSLIVPLPGTALNLEGNKTYDNEVNINFDENGINIERNSETTFNKDVTINSKKEKNPSSIQNIGLLSNIGNQGNSATHNSMVISRSIWILMIPAIRLLAFLVAIL